MTESQRNVVGVAVRVSDPITERSRRDPSRLAHEHLRVGVGLEEYERYSRRFTTTGFAVDDGDAVPRDMFRNLVGVGVYR